jgi:hypothetical protein
MGNPRDWDPKTDQLGNGFMQWYGQDVAASFGNGSTFPYNFSADPDDSIKKGSILDSLKFQKYLDF